MTSKTTPNSPKATKQLLANASKNFAPNSATSATSTGNAYAVDADTKIMVNMLFARFHHIYTHKFESAYGDDDTLAHAKREWALALRDFPLRAVEVTIDAVRTRYSWPPTIAEFLATLSEAASPEDLPEAREAYQEACFHATRPLGHHWRHPAVYHAARKTGFFRLRSEPEQYVWPEFQRHYQTLVLQICRGETLAEPEHPGLPSPPDTGPSFDLAAYCADNQVSEREVARFFHFLELPLGSQVRAAFRARAVEALEAKDLPVDDVPQ